jgi:hypothetical protein
MTPAQEEALGKAMLAHEAKICRKYLNGGEHSGGGYKSARPINGRRKFHPNRLAILQWIVEEAPVNEEFTAQPIYSAYPRTTVHQQLVSLQNAGHLTKVNGFYQAFRLYRITREQKDAMIKEYALYDREQ